MVSLAPRPHRKGLNARYILNRRRDKAYLRRRPRGGLIFINVPAVWLCYANDMTSGVMDSCGRTVEYLRLSVTGWNGISGSYRPPAAKPPVGLGGQSASYKRY